jgi:hypothetical protein
VTVGSRLAPTSLGLRRAAPVVLAAALAGVYLIWAPVSVDLAAHLFRAKLFKVEGFGIWDDWWYAGHDTPAYSVLFPPVAAAIGPQLAAAIAVVATTALFEPLARRSFGEDAWLGALWFAVGAATELFSGRLTFAFGLLPALGALLALSHGRRGLAAGLCVLTALASPVAALFTALAGVAYAGGGEIGIRANFTARRPNVLPGIALALASLAPVLVLAVAFPEGGTEPFAFSALWPIPVIAVLILVALPRDAWTLRIGVILYAAGCVLAYLVPSPVGSNATRLGALVAGPLAALVLWRRRPAMLLLAFLPLLYVQTQAAVRDATESGGAASTAAYYRPLLDFLSHQGGPPFRIEIPFTASHWEAYEVAARFPLARGWERQLDVEDNALFYDGTLSARTYDAWLHRVAVRFVAVADASLDYSARAEVALIDRGLPYLHLVWHSRHWRVFAVTRPTPIVEGATLRALGPDSLTIDARAPGRVSVRVRFTPYWALSGGSGCVAPDGDFTRLSLRRAGEVRLVIRFALDRIGAHSPRCN